MFDISDLEEGELEEDKPPCKQARLEPARLCSGCETPAPPSPALPPVSGITVAYRPIGGDHDCYDNNERPPFRPPQPSYAVPTGSDSGDRITDRFGRMHKTRLCKHFMLGACQHGAQCNYAHGEAELRGGSGMTEREQFKSVLLSKTRLCRFWQRDGFCSHADKCFFAHGEEEMKSRWGGGAASSEGEAPACLCMKPFSLCLFLPEQDGDHVVRVHRTPRAPHNATLLGSLANLCASFYHGNSTEAGVKVCLRRHAAGDEAHTCGKSQVVVVARLRVRGQEHDAYVARYSNCFRGGSDLNQHAEEFLLRDPELETELRRVGSAAAQGESGGSAAAQGESGGERPEGGGGEAAAAGAAAGAGADAAVVTRAAHAAGDQGGGGNQEDVAELVLYMTYQPCHHSGGMVTRNFLAREELAARTAIEGHPVSCTEKLCAWYRQTLRPLRVGLTCVLADIYKAAWLDHAHKDELERKVQAPRSEAAREGMELLLSLGVGMRALRSADWDFLVALCDEPVQEAYARAQSDGGVQTAYRDGEMWTPEEGPTSEQAPFMQHCARLRGKLDRYVDAYLHDESRAENTLSLASGRRTDKMRPLLEALEAQILRPKGKGRERGRERD